MSKLIIAAAGSGKTETLVNMALHEQRPVLITTYTDNNVEEIKSRFYQKMVAFRRILRFYHGILSCCPME